MQDSYNNVKEFSVSIRQVNNSFHLFVKHHYRGDSFSWETVCYKYSFYICEWNRMPWTNRRLVVLLKTLIIEFWVAGTHTEIILRIDQVSWYRNYINCSETLCTFQMIFFSETPWTSEMILIFLKQPEYLQSYQLFSETRCILKDDIHVSIG